MVCQDTHNRGADPLWWRHQSAMRLGWIMRKGMKSTNTEQIYWYTSLAAKPFVMPQLDTFGSRG